MELIGARLQGKVGDATTRLSVLSRIVGHLHFELANGVSSGTVLVHASTAQVVAADSDTVNQDLVAEQLAAVDGARESVTLRPG